MYGHPPHDLPENILDGNYHVLTRLNPRAGATVGNTVSQ